MLMNGRGSSEECSGRSVQGKHLALSCPAKSAPVDSGRLVSWRSVGENRDSVRDAWRSTRATLPAVDLVAVPIHATNSIRPEKPIRSKPPKDSRSLAANAHALGILTIPRLPSVMPFDPRHAPFCRVAAESEGAGHAHRPQSSNSPTVVVRCRFGKQKRPWRVPLGVPRDACRSPDPRSRAAHVAKWKSA